METAEVINYVDRFKDTTIHIGTTNAGGSAKGKFYYQGKKSDIRAIKLSCGSCTKCELKDCYEENGYTVIPFKYIDPHSSNAGTKAKYPNGIINVAKNITVVFNDGSPKKITRSNGAGTIDNPNTARVSLTYQLDVKV